MTGFILPSELAQQSIMERISSEFEKLSALESCSHAPGRRFTWPPFSHLLFDGLCVSALNKATRKYHSLSQSDLSSSQYPCRSGERCEGGSGLCQLPLEKT